MRPRLQSILSKNGNGKDGLTAGGASYLLSVVPLLAPLSSDSASAHSTADSCPPTLALAGLMIKEAENVIIQGLAFSLAKAPTDLVAIQESTNVCASRSSLLLPSARGRSRSDLSAISTCQGSITAPLPARSRSTRTTTTASSVRLPSSLRASVPGS